MKKYEGYWLGRSWVSRCATCGNICLTVADEKNHDKNACEKIELRELSEEEKRFKRS